MLLSHQFDRQDRAAAGAAATRATASASTAAYRQVLNRIRAEYLEMPGMRLTREQILRLCGIDRVLCQRVLDDLVSRRFLNLTPGGLYVRRE
jgi:hypothetical protein